MLASLSDAYLAKVIYASRLNPKMDFSFSSFLLPHDKDMLDKSNKPGSLPDLTNFHVNAAPSPHQNLEGDDLGSPYSSVRPKKFISSSLSFCNLMHVCCAPFDRKEHIVYFLPCTVQYAPLKVLLFWPRFAHGATDLYLTSSSMLSVYTRSVEPAGPDTRLSQLRPRVIRRPRVLLRLALGLPGGQTPRGKPPLPARLAETGSGTTGNVSLLS